MCIRDRVSTQSTGNTIRNMLRWITLGCALAVATAAVVKDQVDSLPGWNSPLPSKLYSGYLDASPATEPRNSIHMHYMFMEAEQDPTNAPLLIWSNGGPGAGSEFGIYTELGPLVLSDASLQTSEYNQTKIPTLFRNPYAWTRVANVLIYDSPAPVGFSYCNDNPGGDGYSCGNWDDYRTAKAAHAFFKNWMLAYPEYNKHDLYLSGESYAGVYIPMLAREILDDPTDPSKSNLKGLAIGDGCVGTEVLCGRSQGPWFNLEFFHGHGQVSDKLYNQIVQVCGVQQLQQGVTQADCKALIATMEANIGGYYGYNLYDECGADNILSLEQQSSRAYFSSVPPLTGAVNDYPCGGVKAMVQWLNNSAVKLALNIPTDGVFFLSDNGVGFNYSLTEPNLMPFYQRLATETDVRVLIYNGDTDPGINSFVSQNWTVALGLEEEQPWRPWTLDGQQRMGGYVTRYKGGLDFLTIRGSGHMVPEYKPKAAFAFLSQWLSGVDYLPYVGPSGRSREL
eukprot:TRINITY_DN3542_c0_g1_i2.p1 TRINITY_DN3542_c0_g1~~TRINITY_DN3542_c0_g1_i2.p1  ORF type:complete len:509 (+),score=117.33 TRINITY_DN3542_c0_g1_i2:126-1652(+)